jgi:hypothetical protein
MASGLKIEVDGQVIPVTESAKLIFDGVNSGVAGDTQLHIVGKPDGTIIQTVWALGSTAPAFTENTTADAIAQATA